MLPILRILPVGGVLLAILILVLALSPPDASRSPMTATIAPARGPLVDRDRHPEDRQFLIQAALKRADELNRLRDLPDTPTRSSDTPNQPNQAPAQEPPKMAALPDNRTDSDPDDATGAINEAPPVSIPAESGEPPTASLTEGTPEESRPVVKIPEPRPRQRDIHRARRTRAPGTPAQQYGLFDFLFNPPQYQYQAQTQAQAQAQAQAYAGRRPTNGASPQNYQTFRNNQVGQQPYVVSQPGQTDQPSSFAIPQTNPY